jgi:hypothetical protein
LADGGRGRSDPGRTPLTCADPGRAGTDVGYHSRMRIGGRYDEMAAVAGVLAAPMFLGVALILSLIQSGFMEELGWEVWPSGLALGPWGAFQVVNFVVFGSLIVVFALGMRRDLAPGRLAWFGPLLLVLAGLGEVLAAFNTDPPGAPVSWHGQVHSAATGAFFAFLLIGYVATLSRRDPLWRGARRYAVLAIPLLLLSEVPNPWGNLLFFAALLTPLQIMAIRLWRRTATPNAA